MKIHRREHEDIIILDLIGNLDYSIKSHLSDCIKEAAAMGSIKILLNFSGVAAVHTTGLGVLVSAYKEIVKQEGQLVFYGVPAHIHELFQVTRLVRLFEIYESEQDAIIKLSDE